MDVLKIVLITIFIYSLITTLIIIISNFNDTVIEICAYGIVGMILLGIKTIIFKIINFYKYHYKKVSIFKDREEKLYFCKTKDTNYYCQNENSQLHLIKRYVLLNREELFKYISEKDYINHNYIYLERRI